MLKTRQQRRTDYATTAPMQTARPRASRSSPEAALRCAEGAGLDGDPHGRATLGHAVRCGATNQPLRRRIPPPRTWRDIPDPNHPQFLPTSHLVITCGGTALNIFSDAAAAIHHLLARADATVNDCLGRSIAGQLLTGS